MYIFNILATALFASLASASVAQPWPRHAHGKPETNSTCNNSTTGASTSQYGPGNFSWNELWDMNNKFWDAFLYPNNKAEAEKINSTLFSEDVLGRIDVTRTFDGRELNTEYVFALFAQIALNPGTFSVLGYPTNYTVQQFVANANVVASTVLLNFRVPAVARDYPIQVVTWFTYNSNREISQYDATFNRFLDWQFADMFALASQELNQSSLAATEALVQQQLAASVCSTAQTYCNGTNQQYQSKDECMAFLTNGSVPLGESWQLGMDTVGCRGVHMSMVPSRPDVHCPHIGPSGGAYCVNDRTYAGYLTENYFVNEAFIPYGKTHANAGSA